MNNLVVLKAGIEAAIDQLLDERDHAFDLNDAVAIATANAEIDKLSPIAVTLQFAINQSMIVRLDAVADRIEASIHRQTASGLSRAAKTLANAVRNAVGRVIPVQAAPVPTDAVSVAVNPPQTGTQPAGTSVSLPASVVAKTGPLKARVAAIIERAERENLDPVSVLAIVSIESNFKPKAQNPNSSAAGLFQFIDSTWLSEGGERLAGRGGTGNGFAAGASERVQIIIGCRFTAKNRDALASALGHEPTPSQLYLAHQQGLGGARRILTADRRIPIESVIGVKPAKLNRLEGLTVAESIAKLGRLVARHILEVRDLIEDAWDSAASLPSVADDDDFAQAVAQAARTEMATFATKPDGSLAKETEEPLRTRALEYFRFVGDDDVTDPSKKPWSGAFISFVMAQAGAEKAQFPFSAGHHTYIREALKNRLDNKMDAPIVYFDRDEIAPRLGDLVGFSRTDKVKTRKDIEKLLPDDKSFPAHTDVVVLVKPRFIHTLGGNLSNTIKRTEIPTTQAGKIKAGRKHFFVLRVNV